MQNNIPDGMLWNRVLTENTDVVDGAEGTYPNVTRTFLPLACQHCQNAACQRVCPTGATYRDDKGRVEIDYDKCIGCKKCAKVCPVNAIEMVEKGKNEKTGKPILRPVIDESKCICCNNCVDDCPKDALLMKEVL